MRASHFGRHQHHRHVGGAQSINVLETRQCDIHTCLVSPSRILRSETSNKQQATAALIIYHISSVTRANDSPCLPHFTFHQIPITDHPSQSHPQSTFPPSPGSPKPPPPHPHRLKKKHATPPSSPPIPAQSHKTKIPQSHRL